VIATGNRKSKIGSEFQMRQPLAIMIAMASTLIQWVARTTPG
jgi:hypothetical protein